MRIGGTLIAVGTLFASGCAAHLAESGQDLQALRTRSQVTAAFGTPVATGQYEDEFFEEFITHRKVAVNWNGLYYALAYGSTLGLIDLLIFPREVYITIQRCTNGQHLRYSYDAEGNVIKVWYEGKLVPFFKHNQPSAQSRPSVSVPTVDTKPVH